MIVGMRSLVTQKIKRNGVRLSLAADGLNEHCFRFLARMHGAVSAKPLFVHLAFSCDAAVQAYLSLTISWLGLAQRLAVVFQNFRR